MLIIWELIICFHDADSPMIIAFLSQDHKCKLLIRWWLDCTTLMFGGRKYLAYWAAFRTWGHFQICSHYGGDVGTVWNTCGSNLYRPAGMHFTDLFPSNHLSVHAGSRPTVQYVASLSELPQALQPYYTQGYVLAALHPIILSVGRTRSLPFSLLYRAILARPRPRYMNPNL